MNIKVIFNRLLIFKANFKFYYLKFFALYAKTKVHFFIYNNQKQTLNIFLKEM